MNRVLVALAAVTLAGCAATTSAPTPTQPTQAAQSSLAAPSAASGPPTPTPKPTPTPADLVFSTSISYATSLCASYGYIYLPFSLTVTNKGGSSSDHVWFEIGALGFAAGGKLYDASWSDAKFVFDTGLLSNTMGSDFIRGPRVPPHKTLKLSWKVQVFGGVPGPYSVGVFTGPATITQAADLTSANDSYGPLSTQYLSC